MKRIFSHPVTLLKVTLKGAIFASLMVGLFVNPSLAVKIAAGILLAATTEFLDSISSGSSKAIAAMVTFLLVPSPIWGAIAATATFIIFIWDDLLSFFKDK